MCGNFDGCLKFTKGATNKSALDLEAEKVLKSIRLQCSQGSSRQSPS